MAPVKTPHGNYQSVVDGLTYEFEKWGAEQSLDTLMDITTVAGKPLGMMAAALFGKGGKGAAEKALKQEITPDIAGAVLGELTGNMGVNKRMVMDILMRLTSHRVICERKEIAFSHYNDRLPHMFRVAKAALEVQYGNFFAAAVEAGLIEQP